MNLKKPIQRFCLAFAGMAFFAAPAFAQQTRPNVVHIFADDLGWGSVGFTNALTHIQTPNLDALAAGGMILNRSYASTVCSPSRANLMTGFHNGHAANDRNGNIGAGIRPQDVSVGEVMTGAGYHTGIVGKWGWGATGDRNLDGSDPLPTINNAGTLPSGQGFSEFYGYLNHSAAHDYYYDYMWQSNGINGATTTTPNNAGAGGAPEYSHDLVSRRSEAFIRDNANANPFYLQVSYTIPHFDLDDISTAPAMLNLAGQQIFAAGQAQYTGNNTLTDQQREHAAMISRMDASIGALIARLNDPNGDGNTADSILNDTMIVFSSDNGTTPEDGLGTSGVNDPRISGGQKGGKRDLYEGGIRMPSFAYWNGTIAAGTTTDLVNDLADFQATAAELAGTFARVGTDGVSILPTLLGQNQLKQREYLLFENFENSQVGLKNADWTIIRGDQKLIKFRDGTFELYNVKNDPGENSPLSLTTNAALKAELESIALAEGAAQPDSFAVEFRDWSGADGGLISNSSNWTVTDDPTNTSVGSIGSLWSARVRNNGTSPATALVTQATSTLGFEVSGATALQTVVVGEGLTLSGRNEVRIGNNGALQLNNASVASNRWVEVQSGGMLTGAGTVDSNLYNSGTISPGFAQAVNNGPPPPPGDFSVAIDFSGVGNQANKDAIYTPLTTNIAQGSVSIDYGASTGSSLTDRNFNDFANEFNLQGWSSGTTLASAITANAFVSVKVAPVSGLSVELKSAGFNFWRNGTNSPQSYGIMTSVNGFTSGAELGTTTLTTSGSSNTGTRLQVAGTAGLSTAGILEVRLYGWNANANGHTHLTAADVDLRFATIAGQTFNPTGQLDITGDFYHLDGGDLKIDFKGLDNSDPANLHFDVLKVMGDVVLAGDLTLNLIENFVIHEGDMFTFLTGNSVLGTFSSITLNNAPGWNANIIYGSNSVTAQFTAVAVPEPAAGLVLAASAGSLILRRRRQE